MSYLIDTCCISELIKPNPDEGVWNWFTLHDEFEMYLSIISFGELRFGIQKLPDSARKRKLNKWLEDELGQRFRKRVLSIGKKEAGKWGELRSELEKKGRPLPVLDLLIAATALVHGLAVVTRNTGDLEDTGVTLVNPWES